MIVKIFNNLSHSLNSSLVLLFCIIYSHSNTYIYIYIYEDKTKRIGNYTRKYIDKEIDVFLFMSEKIYIQVLNHETHL